MKELNTFSNVSMSESVMFKTPTEFSMFIEEYAVNNQITYLEAILDYCEQHMLEPSDVAGKVTKSLKGKLEQNYIDLNYLPKTAQLDV